MSRSDRGSRSLPRRGRARSLSAFVVGVLLSVVAALSVSATAALAAQSTTYQATIVIPVPPASSFQGSGGGDGWGLAMTPTAVYNVFHHQDTSLQVACHLQSDASACWPTKTITDGSGNGFASQGDPGLFLDQATGHLFVFATRLSDLTGGVVCIDTTQPAANLDPFCGFTQLTGVGEAASLRWSAPSGTPSTTSMVPRPSAGQITRRTPCCASTPPLMRHAQVSRSRSTRPARR